MNDMWLTSSHGRAVSFDALAAHRKVAMVTDGRCGPREIAAQLMARGKGHRWMVIGENGDGKRADPLAAGQRRGGRI